MLNMIKNTTKEQRKKLVEGGLALASLDSSPPSRFAVEMYNKYVEGEMELTDVCKAINERYKKKT